MNMKHGLYLFIPELISNDPQLLYDGSFTYLISYLKYTNFTGEDRPAYGM